MQFSWQQQTQNKKLFKYYTEKYKTKFGQNCHWKDRNLPLKGQTKIAADDTLIFLLLFFEENKAWSFMWILCLAENSHEISSLFSLKKKKKKWKKYLWMSYAAVVIGALRVKFAIYGKDSIMIYYMHNKEIWWFLNKLKAIITSGLRRFISSKEIFPPSRFYFSNAIVLC